MKRLIFFIPLFIALLMIINCAVGGFDISIVEDDARTAKSYIKAGQDINKRDFARAGMTPFMKATNSLSFEIAKLLIDEGADVNLKDHSGRTALMHVCHIYHYSTKKGTGMDRAEMMELLLENGADIDSADNDGKTALHYACEYCETDCIRLLLEHGADVNHTDSFGNTALMFAAKSTCKEGAELLIDKGAEVNAKNNDGQAAWMIAIACCSRKSLEEIESKMIWVITKKFSEQLEFFDRTTSEMMEILNRTISEMMEVLVNENTQFSPDHALLFMPTSYLSIDAMAPRNGYLVREKVPLGNKISFDQRGPLPGYVLEIKPGAYDLKADISGSMPLPFENQPLEFRFDGGHIYLALSIVNEQVNRATWRVFEVQIPRKLPLDITQMSIDMLNLFPGNGINENRCQESSFSIHTRKEIPHFFKGGTR